MLKKLLILFSFLLTLTLTSCIGDEEEWDKKYDAALKKRELIYNTKIQQQVDNITKQLKPYHIKDLSPLKNVILEPDAGLPLDSNMVTCNKNTVSSLSGLIYCSGRGISNTSKYIIFNDRDMGEWSVLQVLPNGLLLQSHGSLVMIEGHFPNVIDGQSFSNNYYLLKRIGIFTYTNTLGSTSTIIKLKLVKKLYFKLPNY